MQVVWHGNYFRYMEEGRRLLLANLDLTYEDFTHHGYVFPVVDSRLKFTSPAKSGHEIRIQSTLVEWENRLKINFNIFNDTTQKVALKAFTIHCAVGLDDGELRLTTPAFFTERVKQCLN